MTLAEHLDEVEQRRRQGKSCRVCGGYYTSYYTAVPHKEWCIYLAAQRVAAITAMHKFIDEQSGRELPPPTTDEEAKGVTVLYCAAPGLPWIDHKMRIWGTAGAPINGETLPRWVTRGRVVFDSERIQLATEMPR